MKKACFGCGTLCDKFKYSKNQWSKVVGESKCKTCEETEERSSAKLALDVSVSECPSQSPADTLHEQSEFESLALFEALTLQTGNTKFRSGHLLCSPDLLRGHTHCDIDNYFKYRYLLSLSLNTDPIDGEIE
jgi:hypothetical protein